VTQRLKIVAASVFLSASAGGRDGDELFQTYGSVEGVERLDAGANANDENAFHSTALDWAAAQPKRWRC